MRKFANFSPPEERSACRAIGSVNMDAQPLNPNPVIDYETNEKIYLWQGVHYRRPRYNDLKDLSGVRCSTINDVQKKLESTGWSPAIKLDICGLYPVLLHAESECLPAILMRVPC